MEKRQGLRKLEVAVLILVILAALVFFWPAHIRLKLPRGRVVCGTNLKGLGNAMVVYAHDFDGRYPCLPGRGPWARELGFRFDTPFPRFNETHADTPRTVTASWYLLVRLADVSPKSFVCPQSEQTPFEGINTTESENAKLREPVDIVDLWDFGTDPYPHVSYVMHNPYGRYPADDQRTASFAMAADMSPWMKNGDFLPPNADAKRPPQVIDSQDETTWETGNSLAHNQYEEEVFIFRITRQKDCGLGQNVLYADGHTSYEKTPNAGIKKDNIYTYQSSATSPNEKDRQGGTAPTGRTPENDAKSLEDSFLVL